MSFLNSPEMQRWLEGQSENMRRMAESAMVASLVTPGYLTDPVCMLQLGAAIMMEKPLVLMVFDGTHIPDRLQKVADKIIVVKDKNHMDEAGRELQAWLEKSNNCWGDPD